jgi:hypothetical protein
MWIAKQTNLWKFMKMHELEELLNNLLTYHFE